MPKMYPLEVRLFAVEKKRMGHSWDRVAELISQEFKIKPPSRRQMGIWLKGTHPDDSVGQIREKMLSPAAMMELLRSVPLSKVLVEELTREILRH